MTKLECLQQAAKAQQRLDRLEGALEKALDKVRAKRAGAIDAEREAVNLWLAKADQKEPSPDTINAPPEYRTAEEIAAGVK